MQNKNQIKQNRAKPHTFTSLHMGFVILYLHFLANTVFFPETRDYMFYAGRCTDSIAST